MHPAAVEQWDVFEITLNGPGDDRLDINPFFDVALMATFTFMNRTVPVEGFYDGDGIYRIRYMPDMPGHWTFKTSSNQAELNDVTGTFIVTPATGDNHGPVRVENGYHFAYADGTPFFQIGTTCYAWHHQSDTLIAQTLATLRQFPFNKLRMCVFPKSYEYNENEPRLYPFMGTPLRNWDFTRFNPAFFQHLEARVADLRALGIEADLILFHPYDRWGFATLDAAADERYLRYIVARLAAYRNVWWSLANEFDLMAGKHDSDWDRFFRLIQAYDPGQHLRSVHNCYRWYDHSKPWVTHASVQNQYLNQVTQWRETYRKPIVVDECRYEGNIAKQWGNITGQELVHKFWEGTVRGGYVGHGETYLHPDDILWWSKGGVLHGASPERISFYGAVLGKLPLHKAQPIDSLSVIDGGYEYACLAWDDGAFLLYFGHSQVGSAPLKLPASNTYEIQVIDTWEMTVMTHSRIQGDAVLELPGKPNVALYIKPVLDC
jgi:hypothetical protein